MGSGKEGVSGVGVEPTNRQIQSLMPYQFGDPEKVGGDEGNRTPGIRYAKPTLSLAELRPRIVLLNIFDQAFAFSLRQRPISLHDFRHRAIRLVFPHKILVGITSPPMTMPIA